MPLSLLPPPPRAIRVKKSGWILRIILWLAVFGAFAIAPFFMFRSLGRIQTLISSGRGYEAKVEDSHYSSGKSYHYYLTISFQADGRDFQGDREVSHWVYSEYRNQPKVPVITMPNDSSDFEVGPVGERTMQEIRQGWLAGIGMFGVLGLSFFVWFEFALNNERQLLSKGESVMGTVVSMRVVRGKSTSTSIQYHYTTQFSDRTGRGTGNGNLSAKFPEGGSILVLYSKDNDKRSLPLGLFQFTELLVPRTE